MNISVENSHNIMAQKKKKKKILYSLITSSKKGNDIPEKRRYLHCSVAKTQNITTSKKFKIL